MEKRKLFLTVLISLLVALGCGLLGCGQEVGICDSCDDESCEEGYCRLFEDDVNRCVPDDVPPSESYTCEVYY